MSTIYIRGVPEHLYEELKQLADSDRLSLNAEVLEIVAKGVEQRRIALQRSNALDGLDDIRRRIGKTRGDSLDLLREGRAIN